MLQDAHPLPDSKSKRDGALEMEWPFGDNGIISIYRIRRSPELLVRQVQERYFCFEVISLCLVEKRQILFVLGWDPHITIVTVEDHAGDSLPENHTKRSVIGGNLMNSHVGIVRNGGCLAVSVPAGEQ